MIPISERIRRLDWFQVVADNSFPLLETRDVSVRGRDARFFHSQALGRRRLSWH